MLVYLFLLFTVLPIAELAILIRIGQETAWWAPILLVVATGIAGAALARWQGLRVYERIREEARAGRMPADALVDGFLILLAGILLITPGVLTDVMGIMLLVPPVRLLVKRAVKAWIQRHVDVQIAGLKAGLERRAGASDMHPGTDKIIDAEVVRTHVEDAPL